MSECNSDAQFIECYENKVRPLLTLVTIHSRNIQEKESKCHVHLYKQIILTHKYFI